MFKSVTISFVKIFFMNLCISFSFSKIRGLNKASMKDYIKAIGINLLIGILYAIMYEKSNEILDPIILNLFCYIVNSIIYSYIIDKMDKYFFITMLMAICISIITFTLSSAILFIITRMNRLRNIIDGVIEFLLAGLIQCILVHYFFKIKRFKDGFSFIIEKRFCKDVKKISVTLSIVIVIFVIFATSKNYRINDFTFFIIIMFVLFIIFLIQRSITNHYKSKMKDRTVEYLNEQLQEKDKIIENLKTDLDKTLKINHKYNHRISAMERAIVKAKFNEEFAEENNEIINLVKELAKDYKNETFEADSKLPKTNIFSIDNILEYMANKAKNDNIEFQVDVKCNIKDLITNIVNQSKLATLLADHINDAIIAINYSENELRKILVVFDKIDDIYEIRIYDTGIEFEIETLLKLGKEQVTTHKDSGGTGIGFMTTFETLKESKGSLIIEEDNSEDYSKAIIIKFDNKCEYKIHSYRADEIREQNKNSNIIIEKI